MGASDAGVLGPEQVQRSWGRSVSRCVMDQQCQSWRAVSEGLRAVGDEARRWGGGLGPEPVFSASPHPHGEQLMNCGFNFLTQAHISGVRSGHSFLDGDPEPWGAGRLPWGPAGPPQLWFSHRRHWPQWLAPRWQAASFSSRRRCARASSPAANGNRNVVSDKQQITWAIPLFFFRKSNVNKIDRNRNRWPFKMPSESSPSRGAPLIVIFVELAQGLFLLRAVPLCPRTPLEKRLRSTPRRLQGPWLSLRRDPTHVHLRGVEPGSRWGEPRGPRTGL